MAADLAFFNALILQFGFCFVDGGNLSQCLVGNGLMGQIFGVTLQCFQSIGVISPGMCPTECRPNIRFLFVQCLVTAECIRDQNAGESLQEPLDAAPAPGLAVLVQNHRFPHGQLRGAVNEHIGLGVAAAAILRYLTGGLVHLQHLVLTQMLPQPVIDQTQIPLRTADDPVGHGGPSQNHVTLLKILSDPVQRDSVGILGVHNGGH